MGDVIPSYLVSFREWNHWGRVTHICVSKLTIIGSDNGLSPGRRQAIIWTNAGMWLIKPLETNFRESLIKIHTFSFTKIHLKMSSGKWRPLCLGLNELNNNVGTTEIYMYLKNTCLVLNVMINVVLSKISIKSSYLYQLPNWRWILHPIIILSCWWSGATYWCCCKGMMTSSNGNISRVTGPLCVEFTGPGEFPAQRPVTRGFDVFFDLRLNKRLSKQPWGWWFETLSCPLWRHCNEW